MGQPEQLLHIIRLLDDDTPLVRKAVIGALARFGGRLRVELANLPEPVSEEQRMLIHDALEGVRRRTLKNAWPSWFGMTDEMEQLERALGLLSEFQSGLLYPTDLDIELNCLAKAFKEQMRYRGVYGLAEYLFKELGYGAAGGDYFHPHNSNLLHVIRERKGIPISLTCLYMLVGKRLGYQVSGCNVPRHFLAAVEREGEYVLVDCYNGAQILDGYRLFELTGREGITVDETIRAKAGTFAIVRRYLGNLVRAYEQTGRTENGLLMAFLLKETEEYWRRSQEYKPTPVPEVKTILYAPGQVVYHKRYHYRGIIVDMDDCCKADDQWYYSNQTQPDRAQPWYHVLVHNSEEVNYVAHSNLEMDVDQIYFRHPMLSYFFDQTADGRLVRNNQPWPQPKNQGRNNL